MNNLGIYEQYRTVPETAKKKIGGGRLSGMTDINPMWRIKSLTEAFGPCGIGWYYTIDKTWIETSMATDTVGAFADISLYIKTNGEWSMPIPGSGGSMFVAQETKGLYVNDECFKMALTDALGGACKNLGFGADVWWDKDNTKYIDQKRINFNDMQFEKEIEGELKNPISTAMAKMITDIIKLNKTDKEALALGTDFCKEFGIKKVSELLNGQYPEAVKWLEGK